MASNTPRLDAVETNLVIGGDFSFWQRGVSGLATVGGAYLADRFSTQAVAGYTVTQSQSTDVPNVAQSLYQSRYSLLLTNGTGASAGSAGYVILNYKVEGYDYARIHGRKFRLQFWVKCSIAGVYSLSFQNGAGSRSYVTTYTVNSSNTWQKVAVDIPTDSSGTWLFDNGIGLYIEWVMASGSNYATSSINTWQAGNVFGASTATGTWESTTGATFRLSQVMLIPQDFTLAGASNVDVPFQRAGRTIQQELAMCQRYYEAGFYQSYFPGGGTAYVGSSIPYAADKRATPTIAYVDGSGNPGKISIISGVSGQQTALLTAQVQTNLLRQMGLLYVGGATAYGMIFFWTSDAEL